jgi:DNA-binding CsgD family transcriptional regulator
MLILIAPLPRRYGDAAPLALLALRPTSARASINLELLVSLFKLTSAEAELTLALVGGASLSEIGVLRGTTENTLRSQLRQIFHKTGVHNQAALVGLIGTLPPVR